LLGANGTTGCYLPVLLNTQSAIKKYIFIRFRFPIMKVLTFNIPAAHDKTVIFQEDILPRCYPHFHRHEEIQITLIQKGEGTLIVGDDNVYQYRANEVYVIGANMPHVFKSTPACFDNVEQRTHMLTIFFNPKGKLSTLFDLPELKNLSSFFRSNASGFRIPANAYADISDKILSIKRTSQLEQLLQFFELLKSLGKLDNLSPLAPGVVEKTDSNYDVERMNNIYSFITKNYNKDLTLDMVAEKAYMTPQAFCRYFKKHTGVTFISFLSEIRINEACRKLAAGNHESVSSVALNCGFTNIPNFNRVFKMIVGKSPSLYMSNFNSN
jgi:AraC-like DNA-binding protein